MPDHDEILSQIIATISEGREVDWGAIESGSATDSLRALIAELKIVAGVADLTRKTPEHGHRQKATRVPFTWGHLEVLELLGHGAFGDVYRAWDSRLDREVALKLLTDDVRTADSWGTSIIAEGRLLARIRHANVVTVYGAERRGDTVGIWMELVRGRSLDDIVRSDGPLDVVSVASSGVELCRALSAVHAAGLVHRDVKARNVLREEGGRIVLADFGNGAERVNVGHADDFAGSPLYLAPEIFRGATATPQSDIYSVGTLLFYLVTGSFPIEARTLREVGEAHEQRRYRRLDDVRPGLPETFVRTVERALSVRPSERFQTASEFEEALTADANSDRSLSKEDSAGRTDTTPFRSGTFIAGIIVVAVTIVALVSFNRRTSTSDTPPSTGQVSRQIANPPCTGPPSADGQWVACVESPASLRARGAPLVFTLVLFNTNTGVRRTLRTAAQGERISSAALSPDGTRLAYDSITQSAGATIHVLRLADGSDRQLTTLPADVTSFRVQSWSIADGLLECRLWLRDGTHAFAVISPDSGEVRQRFDLPDSPQGISRSPQADRVAFDVLQSKEGPERDIRICQFDSRQCATFAHPANDFIPFWAPDGRLLFNSDRGRTIGIWAMNVRGLVQSSPADQIADLGRSWVGPVGFSRAGTLFYSKRVGDFDVYVSTLDPVAGDMTPVRLSSRAADLNKAPAWSPDGQWLAFASQRGPFTERGASRIVLRRMSDGSEHEVAHEFQVISARLAWSPDGRYLAFRGTQRGQPPLAAPIRLLDPFSGRFTGAVPDPDPRPNGDRSLIDEFEWLDSSRLVFANGEGIGVIDVRTGSWHLLWRVPSAHGLFRVAVSPDGRDIASVVYPADRSWFSAIVLPEEGGEPRELLRVNRPEVMTLQCWTADGKSLLVTRRPGSNPDEQREQVWQVPLNEGQPRALNLAAYGVQDIRAHRDGRRVALVVGEGRNEFWMASGLLR